MSNKKKQSPDRYALVGHPVEHSRSPLIHTVFARQTAQHLTYELIDAHSAEFETAVRGGGGAGGQGVYVTVPPQEGAGARGPAKTGAATVAGAVNTISIDGGRLRGDNTDGLGFIRDVTVNLRQPLTGTRILVLGAGGAARGIIGPLLNERPAGLTIANRTKERADELVARFKDSMLAARSFAELGDGPAFDVVINATSAGLKGDAPPFPGSLVAPQTFCYDLVYGSGDTPFVAWAKRHGAARAVQGWGMLVEQAAESFAIWRGVRPDTKPLLKQFAR